MQNKIIYFDFVERLIIDRAYQDFMNQMHDTKDYQKIVPQKEPIDFDLLMSDVQEAVYSFIKDLDNIDLHSFFTFSDSKLLSYVPDKRIDKIKTAFWETLYLPDSPDKPISDIEEKFILGYLFYYDDKFIRVQTAYYNLKEDYKKGLLFSQKSPIREVIVAAKEIQNDNLNFFLKALYQTYPYQITVFGFMHDMNKNLGYFKQEVLDNLMMLEKDNKKHYLENVNLKISTYKKYSIVTETDLQVWLDEYSIDSLDDIIHSGVTEELFTILNSFPPSIIEMQHPDYNNNAEEIQRSFYNYYFGFYINDALNFIQVQLSELNPNQIKVDTNSEEKLEQKRTNTKLKTNLSVPQLALLFKLLNDLKPNIFNVKYEADLLRFISANFETKKSNDDGISTDKLRILFNKPDSKAAEFWEKHIYTIITEIKNLK